MSDSPYFDPFDVAVPFKDDHEPMDVHVVNLPRELPKPAQTRTVTRAARVLHEHLVNASTGTDATASLELADCAAIVASTSEPEAERVAGSVDTALKTSVAGDTALTYLNTKLFLTSLMPILQPRAADTPSKLAAPVVKGRRVAEGPQAAFFLEFDSEEHLRAHIMEAIEQTLAAGMDLRASILQHGVSEDVTVAVATIVLRDTDEEFTSLIVRDGLTRTTNALRAALGNEVTDRELPARVADILLAKSGPATGPDGNSRARRKGRAAEQDKLRAQFAAAAADTRDPMLVRTGQTAMLPVRIVTSIHRFGGLPTGEAAATVFPDAVASAVAQIHSLSKPWSPTAIGANAIRQALQRLQAREAIDSTVADVALGMAPFSFDGVDVSGEDLTVRLDPDHEPEIDLELQRGVLLLSALSQGDTFTLVKAQLRSIRGMSQVNKIKYADMISTVVAGSIPVHKPSSRTNGTKAWKAGGPLPHSLYGTGWSALTPTHYADLVPFAQDPESEHYDDARATLAAAGGLALVSDGILLTASGSTTTGLDKTLTFLRRQPSIIVDKLLDSPRGLWVLAHAADSFQSDAEAVNSFPVGATSSRILASSDPYKLAFPSDEDPQVPRKVAHADNLYDLVRIEADLLVDADEKAAAPSPARTVTPGEEADQLAQEISTRFEDLTKLTTKLRGLAADNELEAFGGAVTRELWEQCRDDALALLTEINGMRPRDEDAFDEEDGEDNEENEENEENEAGDDA
ncbi:Uncharacterised protein (plasmid) [Tsukamurella tyrosinosolvens]|uniref:Plant heme peroxidase family profile domain-containing protein n=1 Tax=Tsukamurella tyrosinosolvens TaxID=57704 RepID=A0A1H4U334_TSUTY|nr:hypothetical protein [Tsukamurella tyrosinosolvens]KXO93037.1 hypothetical protein AXK58_14295 [Tsukamurella tyrosinosolvens]SEC62671.1 hypothetical protein SAMN04489793_2770 [Tsukamurella tyrosinosolvens]VEH93966.1 Uncharacterised protein [Tsukamurella tyrosinosolvens]